METFEGPTLSQSKNAQTQEHASRSCRSDCSVRGCGNKCFKIIAHGGLSHLCHKHGGGA